MPEFQLSQLADHILVAGLRSLVVRERAITAELLAHLAEVDARGLYVPAGYPSMRRYCVGELKFSEDAAAKRLHAARAAREHPAIFELVEDGRLHLSGVVLLAPHLTPENAEDLLGAASGKSKAAIEALLVARSPKPDVETLLQPIGVHADAAARSAGPVHACELREQHAPGHVDGVHARVTPLAPERFALQVTLDQETHHLLRQAQDLLGHAVPSGNLAEVLKRSLLALVGLLEKRKFAATDRPRARCSSTRSRTIPAASRREVWERDGGQCAFVSDHGHRCEARSRLEFDHVIPLARGGESTASNLRLLCRAHNQHAADRVLGRGFMDGRRAAAREWRADAKLSPPSEAPPLAADDGVGPWLRQLGFRRDEIRQAEERCKAIPHASLEERVRFALAGMPRRGVRVVAAEGARRDTWRRVLATGAETGGT
jgi:5-methylcytosine-specific restriction endonuclease McrA